METARTPDVIVIGAGVSGLLAACEIAAQGLAVQVLEARDRIGGRIHTLHSEATVPLELGPEFVHGDDELMQHWARQAALETGAAPATQWYVDDAGRRRLQDMWDRLAAIYRAQEPGLFPSFGAWLDAKGAALPEHERIMAREFVEGFHAAPFQAMSARILQETQGGAQEDDRCVKNGYDRLPAALERECARLGVRILLRTVVESVHWSAGQVKVRTREDLDEPGRVLSARAVVVTVPLGVLKAPVGELGAIRFEPVLARQCELLDALQFGFATRIVLRFRDSFWEEGLVPPELARGRGADFGFVHAPGSAVPVWWAHSPEPILVGWAGGPAGRAMTGKPLPDVLTIALRALSKILECPLLQLRHALVSHVRHDWGADPFCRGAYSFAQAGLEHAPGQLAEPVASTLFFAGEATASPSELGTVAGALNSGRRVARQVVQALTRETHDSRRADSHD